ncbi:MAG: ABC transporter permease [Tunicatimonas sp.]
MLKNYLLIAVRNFWKQKNYTLLNVGGLALAIATAILALLFVRHEYSYDRWVPNQKNIYKVYRQWDSDGGNAFTPYRLAEALRNEFPEIASATWAVESGRVLIGAEDQEGVFADKIATVDSSFLRVLPFPLRYGNIDNALERPRTAVLSNETSQKLFGNENPVGRTLRVNADTDYEITGVLAPFAGSSHLAIDALIRDTANVYLSWTGNNPATYVALNPNSSVATLEQKIADAINPRIQAEMESFGANVDKYPDWRLLPLRDVQLSGGQIGGPFSGQGEERTVYVIALVALVIVTIASINYMNMATAQAARRAREVGVRKVTGAHQSQLMVQFLAEAALQCLLALPVAILLTELALPAFENVVNRDLTLDLNTWLQMLPYLLLLIVGLSIVSGSYPAFVLSGYRPTDVLKGQWLRRDQGKVLRQSLVVAQFTGAIVATIVMFFIYQQIRFMQNQELGFRGEQVMVITVNTQETYEKVLSLKSQLLQNPRVKAVATADGLPGSDYSDYGFEVGGQEQSVDSDIFFVDSDYPEALDLDMQEGRFLSPSDTSYLTFVVNEAFVKKYDLKDPVGHSLDFTGAEALGDERGRIIGVVKDFNFSSLERSIRPLVFSGGINALRGGYINAVAVRLQTDNLRETIADVEDFWRLVEPDHPIRYTFLDDDFAGLYAEQERLGQTLLYATCITLFIALLGLFGLASYVAERRTKEVGVRKVLGASVPQIVTLLGVDFLKVVLISGLVAAPIAWWLTRRWLADFAYRTEITVTPFLLAIALAVVVAVLTVSARAIKAALANPVDALRSE